MARVARKMTYEEFAERLPDVLDELARDQDTVLVEKNGHTFRVGPAQPSVYDELPPFPDPDKVREALKKSAGALRGVDVEKLKADLRIQRQQDSSGRPG